MIITKKVRVCLINNSFIHTKMRNFACVANLPSLAHVARVGGLLSTTEVAYL